ncbi:hypothetical protein [Floridanema aerugineum]|uniref:Uncharacterized protein n=1 Tax=Floridaenema aerugineum BLCC-F46 TaxID=3153654 RepID=A0ABV4XGM7_9CYAN
MSTKKSASQIAIELLQEAYNKFEAKNYNVALHFCQAALADPLLSSGGQGDGDSGSQGGGNSGGQGGGAPKRRQFNTSSSAKRNFQPLKQLFI